jgi:hypothetical protein
VFCSPSELHPPPSRTIDTNHTSSGDTFFNFRNQKQNGAPPSGLIVWWASARSTAQNAIVGEPTLVLTARRVRSRPTTRLSSNKTGFLLIPITEESHEATLATNTLGLSLGAAKYRTQFHSGRATPSPWGKAGMTARQASRLAHQ